MTWREGGYSLANSGAYQSAMDPARVLDGEGSMAALSCKLSEESDGESSEDREQS